MGKTCTQPLLEISLSDGPRAGIIHQALGRNEEWFCLLFISLLVILFERCAALRLTEMCVSCPIQMGRLGHQVP
jgi:hypothetical protein